MQRRLFSLLVFSLSLAVSSTSFAQGSAPRVGRDAAAKYFQKRVPANEGDASHYLALHVGKFMSGDSWEWGQSGRENETGETSIGLTYRLHEWSDSMDLGVRVDFNEYKVAGEKPFKMSVMPILMFPDATSRFPLYFGVAGGVGVFFKQIKEESPISFDYQLLLGARFFDVFENAGFFIETGMKNHIQLTSSGQFNGTFLTVGAVFTF